MSRLNCTVGELAAKPADALSRTTKLAIRDIIGYSGHLMPYNTTSMKTRSLNRIPGGGHRANPDPVVGGYCAHRLHRRGARFRGRCQGAVQWQGSDGMGGRYGLLVRPG